MSRNRATLTGRWAVRWRTWTSATVPGSPSSTASTRSPPTCDALVTDSPDLALAVLVADCVPMLAGDGVVAAVHAGRPGLVAGVVPAAVAAMRGLGADTIDAVVGPSVCGRCYGSRGDAVGRRRRGAGGRDGVVVEDPAVDVAAGVVTQLREAGVTVRWVPGCTRSARTCTRPAREASTGRFIVVARSRS